MTVAQVIGQGCVLDTREARAHDVRTGSVIAGAPNWRKQVQPATMADVEAWADLLPTRHQGMSNWCTRFGIGRQLLWLVIHRNGGEWNGAYLSPRFLAWIDAPNERGQNLGQAISTSAHAAMSVGICSDDAFPTEADGQPPEYWARRAVGPDEHDYAEAARHQLEHSYWIDDRDTETMLSGMTEAFNRGFTVVFAVQNYSSFYDLGRSGVAQMTGDPRGWHAMLAEGWIVIKGELHLIVANSWGGEWGFDGYCFLPMRVVRRIRDCRVSTSVEMPWDERMAA